MSVDILKKHHNWLYKEAGFEWQSDQERLGLIEAWRSLRTQTGKRRGDCEDAALTLMERCLVDGVPRERIGIARVATEVCPPHLPFDHAVVVLLDDDGNVTHVSDNRYSLSGVVSPSFMRYKWFDLVTPDRL